MVKPRLPTIEGVAYKLVSSKSASGAMVSLRQLLLLLLLLSALAFTFCLSRRG